MTAQSRATRRLGRAQVRRCSTPNPRASIAVASSGPAADREHEQREHLPAEDAGPAQDAVVPQAARPPGQAEHPPLLGEHAEQPQRRQRRQHEPVRQPEDLGEARRRGRSGRSSRRGRRRAARSRGCAAMIGGRRRSREPVVTVSGPAGSRTAPPSGAEQRGEHARPGSRRAAPPSRRAAAPAGRARTRAARRPPAPAPTPAVTTSTVSDERERDDERDRRASPPGSRGRSPPGGDAGGRRQPVVAGTSQPDHESSHRRASAPPGPAGSARSPRRPRPSGGRRPGRRRGWRRTSAAPSAASPSRSATSSAQVRASWPNVGSSSTSSRGRVASTVATDSRRCSPPDSVNGFAFARCARRSRSSSSSRRARDVVRRDAGPARAERRARRRPWWRGTGAAGPGTPCRSG